MTDAAEPAWIPWSGVQQHRPRGQRDRMPDGVSLDTIVDLKFRRQPGLRAHRAGDFDWTPNRSRYAIIAYRICPEASPDDIGWRRWDGKGVKHPTADPKDLVEVRMRDGETRVTHADMLVWNWNNRLPPQPWEIVAWRLAPKP